MSELKEPQSVSNFREYLKVNTAQPNPDYKGCIDLLKKLYGDIGLTVTEYEPVAGKPIIVFTKTGTDPTLPSILLNSHTDVVPVFENKWKHGPFSGDKDSDGRIYGRGSQDTKGLGIQLIEAVKRLRNVQLLRTVHVSFVPDEEIGGRTGMGAWVKTSDFQKLNVGFAIDEGIMVPVPQYFLFNGERTTWTVEVTVRGQSGHGSMFVPNTVAEKLHRLLGKVLEFRLGEEQKFNNNKLGDWAKDATCINLTMIHGGSHHNVLPDEVKAIFDCRVAPNLDFSVFHQWFLDACKEAGEGVSFEVISKDPKWPMSVTDDSNPYWVALKTVTDKLKMEIVPVTCPGTADARYLRELGITTYGFTPMCKTPTLLHNHDEFVYEDQFMNGIDILEKVIPSLASVQATK